MKKTFFLFLFSICYCSFSFAQIDKYIKLENLEGFITDIIYDDGNDKALFFYGFTKSAYKTEITDEFIITFDPFGNATEIGEKLKNQFPEDNVINIEFTLTDGETAGMLFYIDSIFETDEKDIYSIVAVATLFRFETTSKINKDFFKLLNADVKSIKILNGEEQIGPSINVKLHTKETLRSMLKDLDLTFYLNKASSVSSSSANNKDTSKSTFSTTKKTFTVKGVNFTMAPVQGGTFTMGSTDQDESYQFPPHQVTLSSYMIGETEVTQALWKAVMGSNPSNKNKIGNNYPVNDVSWDDCLVFIKKLNALTGQNFRLPTEAEWEFAARGGNKSHGYVYSGSNTASKVAWYCDTSAGQLHAVKTKAPNELGIYDMSGNVKEWCNDWYSSYKTEPQTNPQGPSTGSTHVVRDGDCMTGINGDIKIWRRGNSPYGGKSSALGLRLAL